ncbi:MAG TPA: sugar kinase [Stellaceae bacterium]|nr:sugar kinase [Stellaceae bacterium]
MIRVAAIGECMLELVRRDDASFTLGFGGDTLNTAIYLARAASARPDLSVDYVTALGNDPMSEEMLSAWRAEGVGTGCVARLAGRLPGLYLIRTDAEGERRFFYWRREAAVRSLFMSGETEALLASLGDYDLLYFSGITLAVLTPEARLDMLHALEAARQKGRRIAFDSNYRPALWPDAAAAREVMAAFLPVTSIALPTFDDERALHGDADPAATAARYAGAGVQEVVVKRGAEGCLVLADGNRHSVPAAVRRTPVDTTAAGDAFNAGYLAARLARAPPERAARAGAALAGAVIGHRGAIIPRDATPSLREFLE